MYNNNSSASNADDKTDSWSFSFEYQRFSSKNKPKSLLGRRTRGQAPGPPKENLKSDLKLNSRNETSSLTYPVNPCVTPAPKFAQPSSAIKHSVLKSNDKSLKSCQRGLGFSTPFRKDQYQDNKENCATNEVTTGKGISKDLSTVFIQGNKDLNTSFIGEEAFPLPGDSSLLSEADQPIKSNMFDKTTDLSLTDNGNNSCFMTAHDIHHSDFNASKLNDFNFKTPVRNQDYLNSKTPGRNFTLFGIFQSPIDPLTGILNEDNESFLSDNSVHPSPQVGSNNPNKPVDAIFISEADLNTVHEKNTELQEKSLNKSSESVKIELESKNYSYDGNSNEVTQIPKIVVKDVDCNKPKLIENEEVQEVKPSLQELSNHEVKVSSEVPSIDSSESKHKLEEATPVVVATAQPNQAIACQSRQSTRSFNSRLLIKQPLAQNILYVNDKAYAVLSLLGRGGSSEVYQALEENSSRLLAIKCVNLAAAEESTANGYLNEIELLIKLQGCPSVIKMFDHQYVEASKMLYVVMEKGDIDLSKLMKDITKTKKLPFSMILYFWNEMLSAVKEIHDKGVIHSDLKPANFLLVCGRLKLIDFGIASSLQGDMTSVEKDVIRGTFNYISPEAICAGENRFHKINYKSDVWSLGCILYNLLFGCTPFSHITSTLGKFQAIADPNYKIKFPQEYNSIHQVMKISLRWCLLKDPKSRPTVDRLLKLSDFTFQGSSKDIIQEFPDCCVAFEDV